MDVEADHYVVLSLPSGEEGARLSDQEISKAYRSKARELHPDKRRDDPNAHADFLKLQTSYEVLRDEKARKLFDDLLRVKREKLQRQRQHDSKRQKMMSDLEERERSAFVSDPSLEAQKEEQRISRKLKEEIARIRDMHSKNKMATGTSPFKKDTPSGGKDRKEGGSNGLDKENQEMRDLFARKEAANKAAKEAKRIARLTAAKEKAKEREETDARQAQDIDGTDEVGDRTENVIILTQEEEDRSEDHVSFNHRKRKAVADPEIVLGINQQTAQPFSFLSQSTESSQIPDFSLPSSSGPRGNIFLEGASGTGFRLLQDMLSPAEEAFLKDMRAGDQMLEGLNRSISGLHMVTSAFEKVALASKSAENRARSSKSLHNQLLAEVTRARDLHFRKLTGIRQSLDGVQEQLEESQNNLHLSRAEAESAQARADQFEREARVAEDDARSANARADKLAVLLETRDKTEEEWRAAFLASSEFKKLVEVKAYLFFKTGFKKCRDQMREAGLLPPEKKHIPDFEKAIASLPADGMEGEEDTDTDEEFSGPRE